MSSLTRLRDKPKGLNESASKVLLVCVYDTVVFDINNEQIYGKFLKFGNIVKVLIFQKGQVTKFFIEFNTLEEAIKAKTHLDGKKMFENICKMNIYYSNFNNVDLKHDTSEGKDFSQSQRERNSFVEKFQQLSKRSMEQQISLNQQFGFNEFSIFSMHHHQAMKSKTDDPRAIKEILKFQQASKIEEQSQFGSNQVDEKIETQIMTMLDYEKQPKSIQTDAKSQTMIPIIPVVDSSKKVLYFTIKNPVEPRQVYNLFSNFGNISRVLVKKNEVFIKFRTVEFSAIANNYLNRKYFFDNQMRIQCISESNMIQIQGQYSTCINFDQSYDRFTPTKSITINPPSATLHISGIKRDLCKTATLFDIFSQCAHVDKVSILHQSSEKNMALVKFHSLEDSIIAISEFHNQLFYGRKMQISFTKSKV